MFRISTTEHAIARTSSGIHLSCWAGNITTARLTEELAVCEDIGDTLMPLPEYYELVGLNEAVAREERCETVEPRKAT